MSIDRATGDLWVGDVGWELWELIDKVERGGNYGWSVMEGPQPVHVEGKRGPTPILPPMKVHPHSEAASITGGYVYRGTALPELAGAYIYGDYQTGIIWGLRAKGRRSPGRRSWRGRRLHLVAFGETNDGELFLVDHDRTHQIYRLVPNPDTGATQQLSAAIERDRSLRLDARRAAGPGRGALRDQRRALVRRGDRRAVPGGARERARSASTTRAPGGFPRARCWRGRSRSSSSRASRRAGAGSKRRSCTSKPRRGGPTPTSGTTSRTTPSWSALRETSRTISSRTRRGNGERTYRVHARSECVLCHNPWVEKKTTVFGIQSASPLGVNTAQMNRPYAAVRGQGQPAHGLA